MMTSSSVYRKFPGIAVSRVVLSLLDRGAEFARFSAEKMALVFLDDEYGNIEDAFVQENAELEEVKDAHPRLALQGEGILQIDGNKTQLLNKGRAEVRGTIVWELTGQEREIVFPAASCRLLAKATVIAPKPGATRVSLEKIHLTVVWE